MSFPKYVKIVEVGPRDGLQNEKEIIPTNIKVELINKLSATGLTTIETTSFVSSKMIPQLSDASEVFSNINKSSSINYPVLIPNLNKLKEATNVGIKDIAVFTAVSETFNKKNTNCSIDESLVHIEQTIDYASKNNINVRGYISCVLGCPYEGKISNEKVASLANKLLNMGCYEVSLGDTIGAGTPLEAKEMVNAVANKVSIDKIAIHFHDTYGQALVNIFACLESGINIIDSSIGGLGGCPYAVGASGNVATEDVVYMLEGMGIVTNIDLMALIDASNFISDYLSRPTRSKVTKALTKAKK